MKLLQRDEWERYQRGESMFRDFSKSGRELLLGYVDEVTPVSTWQRICDSIGDVGLNIWNKLGQLDISKYVDNLSEYQKKIVDLNNTTSEKIEEIFADVEAVDTKYLEIMSELVETGNLFIAYINDLTESINPDGGNLSVSKMNTLLEADWAKLQEKQQAVISTLVAENEMKSAEEYVDAAAGLDLTYDEFQKLSEAEQEKYLCEAADWVFLLYPSVELELGSYEITVPIGVDMTATYNVTVTGESDTDSAGIVKLTIEQQQIVLQSFEVGNEAVSAGVGKDGVKAEAGDDRLSSSLNVGEGQLLAGTAITTGDSTVAVTGGINTSSVSLKYEVETNLSDERKVNSSIELEKGNNTDLPEWEPVPVLADAPVEEPNRDFDYSIEGEDVKNGITAGFVLLAVYESVKWVAAVVLAPETGGLSFGAALTTP